MSRLSPSKRTEYKLLRSLQTRWDDVDFYGHVNNVVYLSYFDTAVNGWYIESDMLKLGQTENVFLVAETGAQFFSEIKFPDVVQCGIAVMRLGSSSVTYDLALFVNDDEFACARGRYTHVLVNEKTRKPVPIAGHNRACLEPLLKEVQV